MYDAIIILGTSPNDDLTISKDLKSRLDKAIELFNNKNSKVIITSGAYSFMIENDPNYREAIIMKKYLIDNELSDEKIITETESKDTLGNAFFTKIICDENKYTKIAVITSNFHIPRSKFIFEKIFGNNYSIDFINSDNDNNEQNSEMEKQVLAKTKEWLSQIQTGNTEAFKSFLYEFHPAYSKNPKITKEQMLNMIKGAQD